jgi:hypothetical protein
MLKRPSKTKPVVTLASSIIAGNVAGKLQLDRPSRAIERRTRDRRREQSAAAAEGSWRQSKEAMSHA